MCRGREPSRRSASVSGLWALPRGCWAVQAIGGFGAVSGMTVDHQLVSDGPYHPVYTAMIAVAVGTTLVFRSYLLLGVAALSIVTHLWWAAAEEKSPAPMA